MRREDPELFARAAGVEALLLERRARLGRDPVYLTRFGRPLAEAIPEEAGDQLALFDGSDPGQLRVRLLHDLGGR